MPIFVQTRFILSFLLSFLIAGSAFSAELCANVFRTNEIKPQGLEYGLRSDKNQVATPVEVLEFKKNQKELYDYLDKIDASRAESIRHLLTAVEFIDYQHTAEVMINNFLDNQKAVFDFSKRYDQFGEFYPGAAYKGFTKARDGYLRTEKPPVSPQLLSEIHKRIMSDGVEQVQLEQLGLIRTDHWMGNARGKNSLSKEELAVIESNPYLTFQAKAVVQKVVNNGFWKNIRIWGAKKDMHLPDVDGNATAGLIHYPYLQTPKQETIDIIKDSHPDLYARIMAFRAQHGVGYHAAPAPELQQEYTQALIDHRFAKFTSELSRIGEIKIGVNEHRYIDSVADLQRDLVAIHPTPNGNGRTTRLLMNYLLTREGLPPVRLVDPFLDVEVSKEVWRQYVYKGVVNSAHLHEDILFRLKNGLVVEHSPELLFPGLPELVRVALKKQSSPKVYENYANAKVDAEQFNAFLKTLVKANPQLRVELKNDTLATMSRIADLFVEYYRSKTMRFINDKDGEREIALRMVDPDFINLFAKNRSQNKELWDEKIERWYDNNLLVWRGLSSQSKAPTRQDLLKFFSQPSSHLVSNSVLRALRVGMPIETAIKKDFDQYNSELLDGQLIGMAMDHHRTGPRYGESYGYSTSKREVVGKAFAMGAMVVGEYGKHKDPALQAKLTSRVNVASYRAIKDVDLGRLKAFDSDFSYIYGRQAEVMAIGGTDPDAVMVVQTLDAKGNVIETFLRNAEKPDEILIIDGRYVPGEGPLPVDKIKERVTIR